MKTALIAPLFLVVVTALASPNDSTLIEDTRTGQIRRLGPKMVFVSQLPRLVAELATEKVETSWIIFAFAPPGEEDNDAAVLYLQYSIEGGKLGLDWVLLDDRNVADAQKVTAFIEHQKFVVRMREGNGVKYLRTEGNDLAVLGHKIICDLYQVKPDAALTLFADKFAYPLK